MIKQPKNCPHCKATNDPWLCWKPEEGDVLEWDCCQAKEKLTPKKYIITFGKHAGSTISDIKDTGYLSWLKKTATEDGNGLLIRCLELNEKV